MFEAVELRKEIPKKQFDKELAALRPKLLKAQYALRETKSSVIIIISGVEGAGKSEIVNRLNEWLDTRWVRSHAFWEESDEERKRPTQWRFWRAMPPRGSIAVMFGSWYTEPVVKHALGKWKQSRLDVAMSHVEQLERMLTDDGHMVVKFWYHISRKAQQKRLRGKGGRRVSKLERMYAKNYRNFQDASARAIRLTDTGNAPWNLIDAEDRRYRDLKTAKILLQFLTDCLADAAAGKKKPTRRDARVSEPLSGKTVLDIVDVSRTLADKEYDAELRRYQDELYGLSWKAHRAERSLVAVFEGWDAAGKGGAIRRVTAGLDARLYSVISIAAPTDEERARHYLWRFWRHLPRDGYITLYDRSWYGRVLVERVEGFAGQDEWMRAYQEINDFEEHLHLHGTRIAKFWLHITPEEQLRRFKERQQIEWKKHKITEEDWRNRQKWNDYAIAVTDMVARTSTAFAPWTLVPGNDKKVARITVLKTLCETLQAALDS